LLVLVIVAGYLNKPNTVQADDRFTCIILQDSTHVTILSCGSSAGNFIENCPVDPSGISNPCDIAPPINDLTANRACADYAENGCPDTLFGDGDTGGIGELMP
jgi:hypothetical protein